MNNAKFLGENDIEDISGQKDQFSGFFGQPTTQKPAQIFIKNSSFSPAPGAKTTTPLFWVLFLEVICYIKDCFCRLGDKRSTRS